MKNHSSVTSVTAGLNIRMLCKSMREYTQMKNHSTATDVTKISRQKVIWMCKKITSESETIQLFSMQQKIWTWNKFRWTLHRWTLHRLTACFRNWVPEFVKRTMSWDLLNSDKLDPHSVHFVTSVQRSMLNLYPLKGEWQYQGISWLSITFLFPVLFWDFFKKNVFEVP